MTDPGKKPRLETLFAEAVDLPARERAAFLDARCGDDPCLRRELETLLDHDDRQPDAFLRQPAVDLTAEDDELGPGDVVAERYRISGVLGVGGMGIVYLAEQTRPVRREVALKVIKLGMDTREVIARFEAERQALAMMSHPSIAKVLDAGVTEGGRPFFVMERVPGAPINEFCDARRLTTEARLGLFVEVCEAIHHAHQKGIIHRDIKPSNILVMMEGERVLPRVIDFGVAKATEQRTGHTMATQQGQLIGTPQYMSPEQATLARDVDTRTDIYSLGVVLYELLTGSKPFPADSAQGSFDEIRRRIVNEDPPRPSTLLSGLRKRPREEVAAQRPEGADRGRRPGEVAAQRPEGADRDQRPLRHASDSHLASIARDRSTDEHTLRRQLRGDLDWIVMKAMEKDRARRYESALDLAADVQRHLRDEPVEAGPPSTAYRFSKFVRRNQALVIGAAAVLVALIAGTIVSTVLAVGQAQARRVAESRREIAELQREEARRAGMISQAVNEFLNEMLGAPNPRQAEALTPVARDVRVIDVLDDASERLTGRFDEPRVEAAIRATLGETYLNLGELDSAEPHLRAALALRESELGPDRVETLLSMNALAVLCSRQGRAEEAERLASDALERRRRAQGPEHEDTLTAMIDLAGMYMHSGRLAEAERLYAEALGSLTRNLGERNHSTILCMNGLGFLYHRMGRDEDAEPLYTRSLELQREVLGADHPDTLDFANNLATLYMDQGRYDQAEPLLVSGLDARLRVLGEAHPDTLSAMINLAGLYRRLGRPEEAEPMYQRAVALARQLHGDDHPSTLAFVNNLAVFYRGQGRFGLAEPLFLEALDGRRRVLGEDRPGTHMTAGNLARLYTSMERFEEAETLALRAHEGLAARLGDESRIVRTSIAILVDLYEAWGRPDEAAAWRSRLDD